MDIETRLLRAREAAFQMIEKGSDFPLRSYLSDKSHGGQAPAQGGDLSAFPNTWQTFPNSFPNSFPNTFPNTWLTFLNIIDE